MLRGLTKELQELQKTFGYSTFQLLDAPPGLAPIGQLWKTTIPGNHSLEITPAASQGGQHTLTVRLLRSSGQVLLNSAVRLRSGATVFVGQVPHQEGDIFIAISANGAARPASWRAGSSHKS
ncbi:MAG: hypothetical protein HY712_03045 [candidate division NC10 bacterium]|nr:hypothetical protein [candidate division NC10 bacterium]